MVPQKSHRQRTKTAAVLASAPVGLAPKRLTSGDGTSVLVADFGTFSADNRLSELLSSEQHDYSIYQIDPAADLARSGAYIPVAKMARQYADAFEGHVEGHSRVFLIGYCGAARLTLHLAHMLGRTAEVPTILVRPTWPDAKVVQAQFAEFQKDLGAACSACPPLGPDPAHAVGTMESVLRGHMEALAAARGIPLANPALAELLTRYRAWLAFILASSISTPPPQSGVMVLTGTAEAPAYPMAGQHTWQIRRLQILDSEPFITQELGQMISGQLRASKNGRCESR